MLEDVEAIRVTITLGRKLLGVLLNVFVPTTILNLIGFSTNFYKVTDDESVFMNRVIYLTGPHNFSTKKKTANQPTTAANPVNPVL